MKLTVIDGNKGKPTRKERIQNLHEKSSLFLSASWNESGLLEWLYIELRGSLSAVPSVKNSRFKGIIAPAVMDKIIAMDQAFQYEARRFHNQLTFGTRNVFLTLVLGSSSRSDPDNSITTIKDWLEPRDKKVGMHSVKNARGWGVGVVNDDKQISGIALRARDFSLEAQKATVITVVPVQRVSDRIYELIVKGRMPWEQNQKD